MAKRRGATGPGASDPKPGEAEDVSRCGREATRPRDALAGPAGPVPGPRVLDPFFTLRLFGLHSAVLDVVLSVAVLLALVASRWAAFPASIWEQDEAYFGCAVVHFDPTANHPHPPWFPLWIALGKVAAGPHPSEPIRGLQRVGALLSVWMLFPLTSLWLALLPRRQALLAALMFLMTPGVWLLSGRAFSEVGASAFLVLALALWASKRQGRHSLAAGSLAATACVLIRPQLVAAVAGAVLYLMAHHRTRRERLQLTVPLAAGALLGFLPVLVSAGGVRQLVEAFRTHADYQLAGLAQLDASFASSGLSRALVHWSIAVAWIVLAGLGVVVALRARRKQELALPLLLSTLAPLLLLVVVLSNPAHPRYFVPVLALTSGLVVVGASGFAGRFVGLVPAAGIVAAAVAVVPSLAPYRHEASPVVRALRDAVRDASARGAVVVADRTLASFVEYERIARGLPVTVLLDSQIESGETPSPPEWATVAVYDEQHSDMVRAAASKARFTCGDPLLRRVSQGRFLDVDVAVGATLGTTYRGTR